MAQEEVIIEIKVESADAIKGIDGLYNNITALKKEQEKLNQQFKEGEISLEEYNKQSKAVSTELGKEEKAFKNLTNAVDVQEGSINELTNSTKLLIKERNNLNLNTEEGRKRLKEINDQIDVNNTKIKENVSGLEKQRLNIGNYASALDGVRGSIAKIIPGFDGMTQGISGVTAGAKAFSATPLIGILTIISTILPPIVDYFKSFAPVMDALEDSVSAVTNTFKGLFENFNLLINAIGGSGKDWDNLKKALNETRAEGQRLLDVQRDLDDKYLDYQLRASKSGPEIRRLLLEAKNRTLSEAERQDKLNKALEIEKSQREELLKLDKTAFETAVDKFVFENKQRIKSTEEEVKAINARANAQMAQEAQFGILSEERRKQIRGEADAEIARIKATNGLLDVISKVGDRYEKLQELRKSGLFDESALKPLADAFDKYNQTVEGGIAIQEKVQNTLDALAQKQEENAIKAREAADKQAKLDAEKLERQKEIARLEIATADDTAIKVIGTEKLKYKTTEDLAKENAENLKKLQKDVTKSLAENEKAQANIRAQALADQQAKEQQLLQLRDQALAAADAIFGKTKEGQIALTLISTYLSAQKAFESQFNPIADVSSPIRGAIAAGLAIAQGLARVNEIRKTTMKSTSGGSPSSGSFNIGQPNGQTISSAATNPINQSFSVANAMSNMPPVYASWKEATEVQNRIKFKESLTTV